MKKVGLCSVILLSGCLTKPPGKELSTTTSNKQEMTFKVDNNGNEIKTYTTYHSDKGIYEIMKSVLFKFSISESNFETFLTDEFNNESIVICGDITKVDQTKIYSIYLKMSGEYGLSGRISCK